MSQTSQAIQYPFGRYQKVVSTLALYVAFQAPFFISVGVMIYSLLYLDYNIWIALFVISLLQYPIRKWEAYINFVKKYIHPLLYFKKFQRIFQQKIPEDSPCMFSFHPHSVFAYGLLANMNFSNDAMSRLIGLSSRFMLNIPIVGVLLRLWGVQSVDAKNLKKLMIQKQNIGLLPGGFEQATLTTPKQMRIFIQNRKGFIKYALKYNYIIYPTIILNQHKAFWTFDYWVKFRMLFNKLKMPGVWFINPKTFVFFPPIQFVTVVGKGLKGRNYSQDQEPGSQQIENMHKQYIKQVKRLYYKYKNLNEDSPLVMY